MPSDYRNCVYRAQRKKRKYSISAAATRTGTSKRKENVDGQDKLRPEKGTRITCIAFIQHSFQGCSNFRDEH